MRDIDSARAHAQAVEFKVPFDFAVSNQVLPAGTYRISYVTEKVILIRCQNRRFQTLAITTADDSHSTIGGKAFSPNTGSGTYCMKCFAAVWV
jgi:hypothetical protein